ncbi:hypothetical protein [Saccharothrix australiensis]|uniref:Excreted virulence factor EspC (Type VII ESX diderm) n=1 Tax=Saccharothrix australiensis TaxID=2072 RepID=A0A495W3Z3_9PSEU|nr:hypothetical protein [Saccharothrix australiensis]RKT55485.1 hypothetical protein C8E97_4154 [Saccharothrix australiensis]
MSDANGFTVHLPALRELSGRLVDLAGRAGQQGDALAGVTADTGRPDSDEAGRLCPAGAAELVRLLRDALTDDSGQVEQCVAGYADVDQGEARSLLGIRGAGGVA